VGERVKYLASSARTDGSSGCVLPLRGRQHERSRAGAPGALQVTSALYPAACAFVTFRHDICCERFLWRVATTWPRRQRRGSAFDAVSATRRSSPTPRRSHGVDAPFPGATALSAHQPGCLRLFMATFLRNFAYFGGRNFVYESSPRLPLLVRRFKEQAPRTARRGRRSEG
jgi:hypothetical protein